MSMSPPRSGCVKADVKVLKFYRQLVCSKPLLQPRLEDMQGVSRIGAVDLM